LIKIKTPIVSIIALTFLIGITANYAIAADMEVIEDDVTDAVGDFHQWQFSGTTAASSLVVTLVCGNTGDASTALDPLLTVQSPAMMKIDDDSFTACTVFSSSIVLFSTGEVDNSCWVTHSASAFSNTGPYTLTLDLSGPGTITSLGEVDSLDSCPSPVGGELIPLDTSALLLVGAQMNAAWMIPVIVSGIGFAIVIARKF